MISNNIFNSDTFSGQLLYIKSGVAVDGEGITFVDSIDNVSLKINDAGDISIYNSLGVGGDLNLTGNLTVLGTTTTIDSVTLTVDDKNIELGSVDTPTDLTADGGGITLKGTTDKTILWENDTDSWDFSENIKVLGSVTVVGDGKDFIVESDDYELALLGNRGSVGTDLDCAYLRLKSEGTNTVVLDTSGDSWLNGGKVGIGTASPIYDLEVYGQGKDIGVTSTHADGTRIAHATMGSDVDGNGVFGLYNDVGNKKVYLSSKPNEDSYILNGNVGIGTASPDENLEITGRFHMGQHTAPTSTTDKLYNVGGNLYWNAVGINTSIATNASNISTNASNISTNTSNISTNASNISTIGVVASNASNGYTLNQDAETTSAVRFARIGVNTAASGTAGSIIATNDIIAYTSSDERLKDNITLLSNPIDRISQINGIEFDWNDESYDHLDGHDVGVLAHEVEKVLPEVVATRDDGYKAVRYEKMVPLLIEAIKEQQVQIKDLKGRLDEAGL